MFRSLSTGGEYPTYHNVVGWDIDKRVNKYLARSSATFLVVGNMPDKVGKVKRYEDTIPNMQAQQEAIHQTLDGWLAETTNGSYKGSLTIALCSGSRGVDLESYYWVQQKRRDYPELSFNVVSILPLQKEDFRKESVLGSLQEERWNRLFDDLLHDPQAIVHEPHLVPLFPGDGKRKVTAETAYRRSALVNGENAYRIYSDTQAELMRLTAEAPHQTVRMLLVTDGGKAYGPGGTNEMVARFLRTFGQDIAHKKPDTDMIHVIQEGLIVDESKGGRRLQTPLENDVYGSQNNEYRQAVAINYAPTFSYEGRVLKSRYVTLAIRSIGRAAAKLHHKS